MNLPTTLRGLGDRSGLLPTGTACGQSVTNAPAHLPDVVVKDTGEPAFKVDTLSSPKFTQPLPFDLDEAIQRFGPENVTHPSGVQFTGVFHNRSRLRAEM
jgi:PKHD-type hydroxylase C-terminal domain